MPVPTIEWADRCARIIDQTRLPAEYILLDIHDVETMAEAIQSLRVRGAPAIGVAGAFGVVLSIRTHLGKHPDEFIQAVYKDIQTLSETRPTAVNLFWALDRMKTLFDALSNEPQDVIDSALLAEALDILREDQEICRQMGRNGAALIPNEATILTHCNAGGLATADYGTALGVIYAAKDMGKKIKVYADETRPLLQGARLTAWELFQSKIDVTVICDSVGGSLMRAGKIDCVIVGADRIAANGDAANKIGTYHLAVLADYHKVPFYVAAPVSTIDFTLKSGEGIPIEERSRDEVAFGFGKKTVPPHVPVYNPAFDVTPNTLITALITEKGVIRYPLDSPLKKELFAG